MHYIIQPYVFWKGHFRQYFENLISDNYTCIYADSRDNLVRNSVFVPSFRINYEKSFVSFALARLVNASKTILALAKRFKIKNDSVHFIEFEPFSFLLFECLTLFRKKRVLITVHSVKPMRFQNSVKYAASLFQRQVFAMLIRYGHRRGYTFVVHYQTHQKQLEGIIGSGRNIFVIEYPCPAPKSTKPKELGEKKLLIYGQIREDKGIYEFLSNKTVEKLRITVAGRIMDRRIRHLRCDKYHFIDKFLSDEEVDAVFAEHDFLLLPYGARYTGGAGPLKDAFSYGMPVICSGIAIFREVVQRDSTGFIYRTVEDIESLVNSVDQESYRELSHNCMRYAAGNTWHTMRARYFDLYEHVL